MRPIADSRNPASLSAQFRRRRDVRLRALIERCGADRASIRILDMGGTAEYWARVGLDFLRSKGARVTLLNLTTTELGAAAGYEDVIEMQVGDACSLPQFADGQFDLVHSNSVIEHVRTWANMKAFAAETRRVGQSYYVQTPYFWFPIDPHYYRMPFFHWLPRPLRARALNALPIAFSGRIEGVDQAFEVVDAARLLDRRQFDFLFPDAQVTFERAAGLAKSMVAIRPPPA